MDSVSATVDQSAASDLVKLTENETEDSFHSDQRDDSVDQEPLDSEESNFSISSEALSQVSSLDSQLSWIQEHYLETNESRFSVTNQCRYPIDFRKVSFLSCIIKNISRFEKIFTVASSVQNTIFHS